MLVYQRVVHRYLITPLSIFDEGHIKKVTFSEILKWNTHNFKQHGKYREASFILSSHVRLCRKVLGWQVKTTLVEVALVSTTHPQSILDPQELPSQKESCLSTITFCYVKLQRCKHWHWNAGWFPLCWVHPEIKKKHRCTSCLWKYRPPGQWDGTITQKNKNEEVQLSGQISIIP